MSQTAIIELQERICPDCGSENVGKASGSSYRCRDCGRSWYRIKRTKMEPDWSKRPPCPRCGSQRVHSQDRGKLKWRCSLCGRVFTRGRTNPAITPITPEDVTIARIDMEIHTHNRSN